MDNTTLSQQSNDHLTSDMPLGVTRSDEIITIKKPHLFRRVKTAVERNPITTAVGASLTLGAALLGGMNYNRYGSPLGPLTNDDVRDVVVAGARAFASLR